MIVSTIMPEFPKLPGAPAPVLVQHTLAPPTGAAKQLLDDVGIGPVAGVDPGRRGDEGKVATA